MLRVLVLAASLLVPAIAFGQVGKPDPQEFKFPDEEVDGKGAGPEGIIVTAPPAPVKHSNLIEIRKDFKEKVVSSVSEL